MWRSVGGRPRPPLPCGTRRLGPPAWPSPLSQELLCAHVTALASLGCTVTRDPAAAPGVETSRVGPVDFSVPISHDNQEIVCSSEGVDTTAAGCGLGHQDLSKGQQPQNSVTALVWAQDTGAVSVFIALDSQTLQGTEPVLGGADPWDADCTLERSSEVSAEL